MVIFSEGGSQRAYGPQPSKKGRMPGPAGEGKGAVRVNGGLGRGGGGAGAVVLGGRVVVVLD